MTRCPRGAVLSDVFYEEETGFSEPREGGRRAMCVRTTAGQKDDGFNTDLERSPANEGKSEGRPSLGNVPRRKRGWGPRRVQDRGEPGHVIRAPGGLGTGLRGSRRGHYLPSGFQELEGALGSGLRKGWAEPSGDRACFCPQPSGVWRICDSLWSLLHFQPQTSPGRNTKASTALSGRLPAADPALGSGREGPLDLGCPAPG